MFKTKRTGATRSGIYSKRAKDDNKTRSPRIATSQCWAKDWRFWVSIGGWAPSAAAALFVLVFALSAWAVDVVDVLIGQLPREPEECRVTMRSRRHDELIKTFRATIEPVFYLLTLSIM